MIGLMCFCGSWPASRLKKPLFDTKAMDKLADLAEPANPLKVLDSSHCSPEDRLAFGGEFDRLLQSSEALDWNRIRVEAGELRDFLADQGQNRGRAKQETRWIPLPQNGSVFDVVRWERAWSRRDLEAVVGFFSEEGFYSNPTLNCSAYTKAELRRLFAQHFHTFGGTMAVTSSKWVPGSAEVRLDWKRSGVRLPGPDLRHKLWSGTVNGTSCLWLASGSIVLCLDQSNAEDLEKIGLRALGFPEPRCSGTIVHTDTMVTINDVVLLKTFRFKKGPPSDGGEHH
jgi:hypothetical protein